MNIGNQKINTPNFPASKYRDLIFCKKLRGFMSSTDISNQEISINNPQTALSKFKALDVDDRLAVLALLYGEIVDEIAPTTNQNNSQDENAANLVKEVQNLPSDKQVDSLREILSGKRSSGETELDPNPSQALGELFKGGEDAPSISTNDYNAMSAESKLSFWFQAAQNLGKSIVGVPADFIPNERVNQVLELLDTQQVEHIVSFLKKAL